MKKNIHPNYHSIKVIMTDGTEFTTMSTYGKEGEILNDMLFNSDLETINNVGHFHPLESPLEVNDIIIKNL